jgi:Mg/Co/Ni transporter MgtE
LYWPVLGRAIRVASVVGTVLFFINQSDVVLRGDITPLVIAKIGLTYLVPFSVSTYSALAANRLRLP